MDLDVIFVFFSFLISLYFSYLEYLSFHKLVRGTIRRRAWNEERADIFAAFVGTQRAGPVRWETLPPIGIDFSYYEIS